MKLFLFLYIYFQSSLCTWPLSQECFLLLRQLTNLWIIQTENNTPKSRDEPVFLYTTENLVKKLFKMIPLGTLYLSQNTLFVQMFLVKLPKQSKITQFDKYKMVLLDQRDYSQKAISWKLGIVCSVPSKLKKFDKWNTKEESKIIPG